MNPNLEGNYFYSDLITYTAAFANAMRLAPRSYSLKLEPDLRDAN